jgi:actin-like ATPase involved in cell morphogenesis
MVDWLLGVDFGTSNTAAAHVNEVTGAVQPLPLSHHSNLMPSAVFITSPSQIDVGDVALNKAAYNPTGFIAAPKRLLTLGQSRFQIGDFEVPAHRVVAAVLRSILNRGKGQHQGNPPSGIVLTHPEGWSAQQVRVLTDAAAELGYGADRVWTLSEPRAAANYYSRSNQVVAGEQVAVFDFGGGTLDVAILTKTADGNFDVLAAQGDNALGGRNFDAAIRRWVDTELSDRNPALLSVLEEENSSREQRALEDSIRDAKEVLSEAPQASIGVSAGPGKHEVLLLTRGEFEDLIEREVRRGVELARATFRAAGVDGGAVSSIYLTGGSSRIPLVHQRIQGLGRVATLDDPKTVVAQGALLTALANRAQRAGMMAPPRPSQPAPQHWPQPPRPAPPPPQQPAPAPAPKSSTRPAMIVAAVVAIGVVGAGVAIAVSSSGGGSNNSAATTTAAADTTPSATATTDANASPQAEMAAVVADFPAQLKAAATCSPPTEAPDPVDHYNQTDCVIKAGSPLVAGLFQNPAQDVTAVAGIHSDPTNTADVWKQNNIGGVVRDDATALVVVTGPSQGYEVQYLNKSSGLDINVDGLASRAAATTFLRRAGFY